MVDRKRVILVRSRVLQELYADPEWSAKMEEAKTVEGMWKVLAEFCRSKNYKLLDKVE